MKLSFGNMTLKLNDFNICKQPHERKDESEEANMIETIVEDRIQKVSSTDPLEMYLINSFESNIQLDPEISDIYFLLDCI